MKKSLPIIVAFAVTFLFLIQAIGTLVESIYILDLMNLNLDTKVLGLLFFFTPVLLIPLFRKFRPQLVWVTFGLLLVSRGALPYLDTANRLIAAGVATGAAISLFLLLMGLRPKGLSVSRTGLWASGGLALATGLSVLLRTVYFGVEYSLSPAGGWSGILLGLVLGGMLTQLEAGEGTEGTKKAKGVTSALLGIFLILTLIYFAFSAPDVIARWTEGSYTLIVLAVSLLSAGWVLLLVLRPGLLKQMDRALLLFFNLAFTICLTGTILIHRVAFPPAVTAPAVTVTAPLWWQAFPLVLMLVFFPVLLFDLGIFTEQIWKADPAPSQFVPGLLIGALALILLVFANIFSNVWGYVKPISLFFRGKFWLSFFLPAAGISLLAWLSGRARFEYDRKQPDGFPWIWAVLLGTICLGTLIGAWPVKRGQAQANSQQSITVMTYNIQGANDRDAQKSFERQLANIRKVSPDILALQETDTARISFNNNDYARFYADSLGYYSYYGPSTVTGTFGTSILSKYPLQNTRAVFTFSDTDEIAVAEAEVEVSGYPISIYDVHPDGSDLAKMIFVEALLQRLQSKPNVIALGDYNLPDTQPAYQLLSTVLNEAWTSLYPTKVNPQGVDMTDRIDHIFVSQSLSVREAIYLLPPASASDHPVHWAEILLNTPK